MKPLPSFAAAFLLLAASLAPLTAANYTMPRFAFTGGGGVSANVSYSLAGAIGESVSGESSDSRFTVRSGFWPVPSTQCSFVGIRLEPLGNGRVRVSWPLPECGYLLDHSLTLAGWAPLPPPYTTNEASLSVIRSNRAEFFRLRSRP